MQCQWWVGIYYTVPLRLGPGCVKLSGSECTGLDAWCSVSDGLGYTVPLRLGPGCIVYHYCTWLFHLYATAAITYIYMTCTVQWPCAPDLKFYHQIVVISYINEQHVSWLDGVFMMGILGVYEQYKDWFCWPHLYECPPNRRLRAWSPTFEFVDFPWMAWLSTELGWSPLYCRPAPHFLGFVHLKMGIPLIYWVNVVPMTMCAGVYVWDTELLHGAITAWSFFTQSPTDLQTQTHGDTHT